MCLSFQTDVLYSLQGVVLASTLESLDSHINVTVEVEPSDLASRANNLAVVLASLNTFYEDRYGERVT